MEALVQIAGHTPAWVFAVLVYGLSAGVRAMWERKVSLWAVSIVPLLFLGLSLSPLLGAIRTVTVGAPVWAAALAVGVLAGSTFLSPRILDAMVGGGRVRIAGSPVALVLFIGIFAAKYYYNVRIALHHSAASDPVFVSVILALSGFTTGVMFGRVGRLFTEYFGKRKLAAAR